MRNRRFNKNKEKNIKMAKVIVLFIITAVFVIGGSTLMALKFSESKQTVQAAEVDSNIDSEMNSKITSIVIKKITLMIIKKIIVS